MNRRYILMAMLGIALTACSGGTGVTSVASSVSMTSDETTSEQEPSPSSLETSSVSFQPTVDDTLFVPEGDLVFEPLSGGGLQVSCDIQLTNQVLRIPARHDGQDVVKIKDGAFRKQEKLRSLIVPGAVKEVGAGAFADCPGMKAIWLQDGVEEIGENAFADGPYNRNFILPETIIDFGDLLQRSIPGEYYYVGTRSIEGYSPYSRYNPASRNGQFFFGCKTDENGIVFANRGPYWRVVQFAGYVREMVPPASFEGKPVEEVRIERLFSPTLERHRTPGFG